MRFSLTSLSLLLASGTAAALGIDGASFSGLDLNKDNRISFDEAKYNARLSGTFMLADLNGDGLLDRAEFARQLVDETPRLPRG